MTDRTAFWGPEQICFVAELAGNGLFPSRAAFANEGTMAAPMPAWLCYHFARLYPQWSWETWRREWMNFELRDCARTPMGW